MWFNYCCGPLRFKSVSALLIQPIDVNTKSWASLLRGQFSQEGAASVRAIKLVRGRVRNSSSIQTELWRPQWTSHKPPAGPHIHCCSLGRHSGQSGRLRRASLMSNAGMDPTMGSYGIKGSSLSTSKQAPTTTASKQMTSTLLSVSVTGETVM